LVAKFGDEKVLAAVIGMRREALFAAIGDSTSGLSIFQSATW